MRNVGAIIDRPRADRRFAGETPRVPRGRNAETAFPTLHADGFLLDLRADAIRPYLIAADRTVGRAYMRAAAAVRCETTPPPPVGGTPPLTQGRRGPPGYLQLNGVGA